MNGARRLVLPIIALSILVGIGAGLFMGWRVWPVTWYNTDPSDLRLQHQFSWVIMASDSLAVTGDVDLARQRLFALTDDETDWQWVADLVEQAAINRDRAEDTAGALRLRRMAQSLDLPQPTGEEVTVRPPAGIIPPTVGDGMLVAGSIFALFVGVVLIIWLALQVIQSRMATAQRPPYHATQGAEDSAAMPRANEAVSEAPVEEQMEEQRHTSPPFDSPEQAPSTPPPPIAPQVVHAVEEDEAEAAWEADDDVGPNAIADEQPIEQEEDRPMVTPAAASPRRPTPPLPDHAIDRFEAEYQYGDDDLDVSYSIESSDGEFLGECGLSVADILEVDEGGQQIDAFEVWLFDKGDIRTVSKIIVSDLVLDDDELRQQLEEKGELVLARPGVLIELETLSLRLEAQIVDYRYRADADLPDAIFEFLQVELTVFEPEDG
jgi:hypothetical protein